MILYTIWYINIVYIFILYDAYKKSHQCKLIYTGRKQTSGCLPKDYEGGFIKGWKKPFRNDGYVRNFDCSDGFACMCHIKTEQTAL